MNAIATSDIPQRHFVRTRGCTIRWRLFEILCRAYSMEVVKPEQFRNWSKYDNALEDYRFHMEKCEQCRKRNAEILNDGTVVVHPDAPEIDAEKAERIAEIRRERGL